MTDVSTKLPSGVGGNLWAANEAGDGTYRPKLEDGELDASAVLGGDEAPKDGVKPDV